MAEGDSLRPCLAICDNLETAKGVVATASPAGHTVESQDRGEGEGGQEGEEERRHF